MAGPKHKPAARKPTGARQATKTGQTASVQKRAARDVPASPSARRIDRSLNEGTRETLEHFRSTIDWS